MSPSVFNLSVTVPNFGEKIFANDRWLQSLFVYDWCEVRVHLQAGDRVGVVRQPDGCLHFYVNGVDQGLAACDVPDNIYGVIDLYGQAAQATIINSTRTALHVS